MKSTSRDDSKTVRHLYLMMVIVILIIIGAKNIFKNIARLHESDFLDFTDYLVKENYRQWRDERITLKSSNKVLTTTSKTTEISSRNDDIIERRESKTNTEIDHTSYEKYSFNDTESKDEPQPILDFNRGDVQQYFQQKYSYPELPIIIFHKTHKTGGSAIQNILFRLAYNRAVNIGWPKIENKTSSRDAASIFYPQKFEEGFIGNLKNSVDILCNHVAYSNEILNYVNFTSRSAHNIDEDSEIIPKRKVFRFTILREAFSLLKSTFNYYRDYENYCFKGADYLTRFIKAYEYFTTGWVIQGYLRLNLSRIFQYIFMLSYLLLFIYQKKDINIQYQYITQNINMQDKPKFANQPFIYCSMLLLILVTFSANIRFESNSNLHYKTLNWFIKSIELKISKLPSYTYGQILKETPESEFPAIMFFKTHKSGSSSVQNILYRLAYKKNLSIGWPKDKDNSTSLMYPKRFSYKYMANPMKSVDILANHVRYNKALDLFLNDTSKYQEDISKMSEEKRLSTLKYDKITGRLIKNKKKVFKFTILREAFSLLKSTFNYYRDYEMSDHCMKGARTLDTFIKSNWYFTTFLGWWEKKNMSTCIHTFIK